MTCEHRPLYARMRFEAQIAMREQERCYGDSVPPPWETELEIQVVAIELKDVEGAIVVCRLCSMLYYCATPCLTPRPAPPRPTG